MKVYVQNGHNKKVLVSCNYTTAAIKFVKGLISKDKNGEEVVELSPITFVSNCGFPKDLMEMKMGKEYDKVKMFRTSRVLDEMGRKDMGKWMRGHEKTLEPEVQKLVRFL